MRVPVPGFLPCCDTGTWSQLYPPGCSHQHPGRFQIQSFWSVTNMDTNQGERKLSSASNIVYHIVGAQKINSLIQIFLALGQEWRSLGRWCSGTRWSSCTEACSSGWGDQRCLHIYAIVKKKRFVVKTWRCSLIGALELEDIPHWPSLQRCGCADRRSS